MNPDGIPRKMMAVLKKIKLIILNPKSQTLK